MHSKALFLSTILCGFLNSISGSNVLVFLPVSSKSHKNTFDPLIDELFIRGHNITLVTSFPTSKQLQQLTTVVLNKPREKMEQLGSVSWNMSASSPLSMIVTMSTFMVEFCTTLYEDPNYLEFLKNSGTYDVVLVSAVFNDCYLPIAGKYGAPIVMISPAALLIDVAWEMNIPHPWSYIPILVLPYSSEMTFLQRLENTFVSFVWVGYRFFLAYSQSDSVIQRCVPDAPKYQDVIKNISFLMVNSHSSFDGSKPSMPNVAEVGGMHCRPAKPLPEEFEKFINSSGDEGFIVFSMGSIVESQYLPQHIIDAFKDAFSKIKQFVIWKFEKPLEGLSGNVMISKWIPQQDLIGHPKCRLAITHGGLLSLQEVAYHGVPLLGLPLGADRDGNLKRAVQKGFAEIINWRTVTPEIAFGKITEMIGKKTYKEKASEISSLMKDRPESAVNTAAYWVEYVIRHKGAKHLRSGAENLSFCSYFLLDIIAFFLLIFIVVITVPVLIIRKLMGFFHKKHGSEKKLVKSDKKKSPTNASGKLKSN